MLGGCGWCGVWYGVVMWLVWLVWCVVWCNGVVVWLVWCVVWCSNVVGVVCGMV